MNNSSQSYAAQKKSLRSRFRTYRSGLSPGEYNQRSRRITERLLTIPEVQHARCVHIYWPMVDKREIDTRPIIEHLHRTGITVVLPVVLPVVLAPGSSGRTSPRMTHLAWDGHSLLKKNRWGVSEPQEGKVVPADSLDLIIVPALGGGRNGHRIGHGKGYYDQFLSTIEATTIGLIYEECLLDSVPYEAHDEPLNVIVSESETVYVRF